MEPAVPGGLKTQRRTNSLPRTAGSTSPEENAHEQRRSPALFRAPDGDAHPIAALARSGHSPNGTLAKWGTRPSARRNARPRRGRRGAIHVHSTPSVCHSERREESTWSSAACSRGKAHAGFFASLRMTAAVQLPRFVPSERPCFRDHARLDPHFLATVCAPSRNHFRTFAQPCAHIRSTVSAHGLDLVRTFARGGAHLVATMFTLCPDRVRTRARRGADGGTSQAQQKSRGQNGARLFRDVGDPQGVQTLACITAPAEVGLMRTLLPVSVSRMHRTLELRSRAV